MSKDLNSCDTCGRFDTPEDAIIRLAPTRHTWIACSKCGDKFSNTYGAPAQIVAGDATYSCCTDCAGELADAINEFCAEWVVLKSMVADSKAGA